MKILLPSQLQILQGIRKPTPPAPKAHKSKKEYNRNSLKKDLLRTLSQAR